MVTSFFFSFLSPVTKLSLRIRGNWSDPIWFFQSSRNNFANDFLIYCRRVDSWKRSDFAWAVYCVLDKG